MIAIVDAGLGNVRSIDNMLQHLGVPSCLAGNAKQLLEADKIILPGVGAFDKGVSLLQAGGFWDVLNELALDKRVPVMGICLGMQMMATESEEGTLTGLSWIPGRVVKLDKNLAHRHKLRIPHMGWTETRPVRDSALFECGGAEQRFYFVHSYHVACNDSSDVTATSWHGTDFVAAFEHDNLLGVQFHPEKSHKFGMGLLQRFAQWSP